MKKKGIKGSITIFLTIILVPMIAISGLIVDMGRFQLAKSATSSAADLTLRSYLANYDSALKNTYGLFSVSQQDSTNYTSYFNENMGFKKDPNFPSLLQLYEKEPGNTEILKVQGDGSQDSSLANDKILKAQIVEYMKYRAPIQVGLGLFDSLEALKKIDKQSDVLKAKVKVDEESGKLADYTEPLYDAIKNYIDIVPVDSEYDVINGLQSQLQSISDRLNPLNSVIDKYKQIDDIKYTGDAYINKLGSLSGGKYTDFNVINVDDPMIITNIGEFEVQFKEWVYKVDLLFNNSNAGLYTYKSSNYSNFDGVKSKLDNLNGFLNLSVTYNESEITSIDLIKDLVTLQKKYNKLKETKKDDLNNIVGTTFADVNGNANLSTRRKFMLMFSNLKSIINQANNTIQNKYNSIAGRMYTLYSHASSAYDYAKTAVNKADDVIKQIKVIEDANGSFKTSITSYEGGEKDDFSVSMNQNHQNNSNTYKTSEVEALKSQLETARDKSKKLKEALENTKYCNMHIYNQSNILADKYRENKEIKISSDLNSMYSNITERPPRNFDSPFWNYLKSMYENKSDNSSGNKAKITGDKGIITQANTVAELAKGDGKVGDLSNKSFSDKSLPSGGPVSHKEKGIIASITNSFKNITSDITGMFSGLSGLVFPTNGNGNALEQLRDNYFVVSYAMRNFSYFTQEDENRDKDGSKKDLKTFSGVLINAATNKLYKGEVEYLIYGEDTVKKNVKKAKSQIFGIRSVVNIAFALTNSQVNQVTGAIASGVAIFGIPPTLIRVLLDVVLGTAESSVDMLRIMSGEKVPLFKDQTNFILMPTGENIDGLLNLLESYAKKTSADIINDAANKAKSQAKGYVNDAVNNTVDWSADKVNEYVSEVSNTLTTQLQEKSMIVINGLTDFVISSIDAAAIDNSISDAKAKLKEKIQVEYLNKLENKLNEIEGIKNNPAIKQAVIEATNSLANDIFSEIDNFSSIEDMIKNGSKNIQNKVKSIIAYRTKALDIKIKEFVKTQADDLKNTLNSKANELIDSGVDKMSDYATKKTDELLGKVFDKNNKFDIGEVDTQKNKGFANFIQMSYSDYIQMFLIMNLINTNKDEETILRIADLIQLNIQNGASSSESNINRFNPASSFSMKNTATYVSLKTDIKTDYIFIGSELMSDFINNYGISGGSDYSKDYNFQTVLGY